MLRRLIAPLRQINPRFLGTVSKAELIEEAKNPDVFIIDVRDNNEVAGGTIPAANWSHLSLGDFQDALTLSDKNFELIYEIKKPKPDQKVTLQKTSLFIVCDRAGHVGLLR